MTLSTGRNEKNVNGTITRYVYDRGNIHLEYDGENTFQAKYVHTDNVDEAVMMIRPENPYRNAKFPVQEFYYHRDRLGNITEITDFEGTVVQRYVYDAFGKVSIFDKDGNAITPDSAKYLKSPYAFTGREYDPETGMYFYRARYYDPDSGRFISEDPIGFGGQDANLYRYVGNNSVNFVDSEGKIFENRIARETTPEQQQLLGTAIFVTGAGVAGVGIKSGNPLGALFGLYLLYEGYANVNKAMKRGAEGIFNPKIYGVLIPTASASTLEDGRGRKKEKRRGISCKRQSNL